MRFKIDWANLIVRSKFTTFALFYFVFEGNFPYEFGGLISGGAYTFYGFTAYTNFTVYVRRSKYFLEFLSLKDG